MFQEKQWQPLMSNWPLLFVSRSFTFCLCLWCGPQWQQTALLSILNFCAELQHLNLGSCVMVSAWKSLILDGLFSFCSHGWGLLDLPHRVHIHILCTPHSNIFPPYIGGYVFEALSFTTKREEYSVWKECCLRLLTCLDPFQKVLGRYHTQTSVV